MDDAGTDPSDEGIVGRFCGCMPGFGCGVCGDGLGCDPGGGGIIGTGCPSGRGSCPSCGPS